MTKSYDAGDITVLEGLEAVRLRPGMYVGGTGRNGLHHLVWEVVDNSVDEVINGHANCIWVTLHKGMQSCTVQDNGRGIPVDIHPQHGVPALTLILTTLHAGGKFDDRNYKTAGGLHGVGSSVVNALSAELRAEVKRGGKLYRQEFRRGQAQGELTEVADARGSGTSIFFAPDSEIFGARSFEPNLILERLAIKAYLNPGLKIIFRDEHNKKRKELLFEGGLRDLLSMEIKHLKHQAILTEPFHLRHEGEDWRLDAVLGWTDAPKERFRSFANTIPTTEGGTHEQGLKDALVKALRSFIQTHSLTPRGVQLTAEDLREGVMGYLSLFLGEPQFQGQTKDKLNNPEARGQVEAAIRPQLEQWLHSHKPWGEALVARAIQASRARAASRAAAQKVRKKGPRVSRLNLPGKLADCSSRDTKLNELFIVEGDSAGGSAKQARDRKTQAILPLRGKILNAEQGSRAAVEKNEELKNVVQALGCGMGRDFDLSGLRYGKIILLMDADVDGHHIATLLLTFLYRYLPGLIRSGHVYLAQPPLYRIISGSKSYWAADDSEKEKILKRLPSRGKPEISRFKGLGEMMPKTLFSTTLDPKRRRLLQVGIPEDQVLSTENTIRELMGKDPRARYENIIAGVHAVEGLDV